MSEFSFPPPPPPPPKLDPSQAQNSASTRGYDRGRGPGSRGSLQPRGRGGPHGGRNGKRGQSHYQIGQGHSNQTGNSTVQRNARSPMSVGSSSSAYPAAGSPPRTTAGHKRKLEALRGPAQKKPEKRPAPATAPAVPTFGAPLISTSISSSTFEVQTKPADLIQQKSSSRGLGLTPGTGDPQYSSSDDEQDQDADEEAMYAELGDKLSFEHNGVVMSLNSQADLVAWKQDRRKKWPTKARMVEKDEERRQVGEERKRLLAGANELYGTSPRFAKAGSNIWTNPAIKDQENTPQSAHSVATPESRENETGLEQAKREMAEKTKRLDELRRKVMESETRNRKARESAERSQGQPKELIPVSPEEAPKSTAAITSPIVDDHDVIEESTNGTPTETAVNARDDNDSSSLASSSDSSSDSSEADSDDEPPEEMSTKAPQAASLPEDRRPLCKYFRTSGSCRNGDACRFKHDQALSRMANATPTQQRDKLRYGQVRKDDRPLKVEQISSSKKTIFQRLVEQEEEEDDRLALKVVKYLGEAGFFR